MTGVEGSARRSDAFLAHCRDLRANTDGTGDPWDILATFADYAVEEFCDCCSIVPVDALASSPLTRHTPGSTVSAPTELLDHMHPDPLSGRVRRWPPRGDVQWLFVDLEVDGQPFATVALGLDDGQPGFTDVDASVADQAAWFLTTALERRAWQRDAREAIRRTQRIASQLHQLIAASISVGTLRREEDILSRLAASTRNVFEAETGLVSLEEGPAAPLVASAQPGQAPICIDPRVDHRWDVPSSRRGQTSPWTEEGWLVAPILEQRHHARGVIAVRRDQGPEFGTEDREVLTLLAQMAATTIGAVELSRTIQRSEARWRGLVETAPIGIFEVDGRGGVRWWNRAAGRIFAWPDHSENAPTPVLPESARASLVDLWTDVLEGALSGSRDLVDVEIHGRQRHLSASAVALPATGADTRTFLTLVDDVTDHRELKAELRHAHQMETRGQVASSVAHDFNNLITLISGYAEMLAASLPDDGPGLEMVRDIQATASRAAQLTTRLQAIGRTQTPDSIVVDPVGLIESDAEVIERIVGPSIELEWSLDPSSPRVRIDADQFEQMILNLSLNARDAMPEGGRLHISVSAATLDLADADELGLASVDLVRITIADTGVGMDAETLRRCFEPLFTTKGPFKGTGIGLAAARRLVEESGGVITCHSAPGEGATFEVLLPAVREPDGPSEPAPSSTPPRRSATVLLAEDEEGLRRLASQVLARSGYTVLVVASGEGALEESDRFDGSIDLLISDVVMNELSGPDLARRLQDVRPELRVLLMSGTADASVLEGLAPGSAAFLAKPFKPSALVDAVDELLARS